MPTAAGLNVGAAGDVYHAETVVIGIRRDDHASAAYQQPFACEFPIQGNDHDVIVPRVQGPVDGYSDYRVE